MYSRNKGICEICGKKLSRNRKWLNVCSPKCYGEYLDNETIAAYERLHNLNMGVYLHKRYVEDQLTIKELLRELGMPDNHRRLKRWLARYGIKARSRSEGVKLQHKRNPSRRVQFKDMARSYEVRIKQAQSRQSNHRETSLELAAISLLREFGISAIAQYAIDIYNFDIGLPDYKIGIELDGGNWHKERKQKAEDNERDAKITKLGWQVKRFSPEDFGRLMKFAKSLA